MEEQIQDVQQQPLETEVVLTRLSINYLRATSPWAKLFSILGFIVSGLLVIVAFVVLIGGNLYSGSLEPGMNILIFFLYMIIAVIIFFPNKYLLKYANGIKNIGNSPDKASINTTFLAQKKYWTFLGILTIIYFSIIVLGLIAFIIGDLSSGL